EGQIRSRVIRTDDRGRQGTEQIPQLRALRVVLRELRGGRDRQLVEAADVPACRQQQPGLRGDQRPQPHGGGGVGVAERGGQLGRGLDRRLEQRQEDLRLRREVVVQRGLSDAHGLGDLVGRRGGETLRGEQFRGGVENLLTRGGALTARAVLARPSDCTGHAGLLPEGFLFV